MSHRRLALFVLPVTIGMTALTAAAFPVFAAAVPTTVTATGHCIGANQDAPEASREVNGALSIAFCFGSTRRTDGTPVEVAGSFNGKVLVSVNSTTNHDGSLDVSFHVSPQSAATTVSPTAIRLGHRRQALHRRVVRTQR